MSKSKEILRILKANDWLSMSELNSLRLAGNMNTLRALIYHLRKKGLVTARAMQGAKAGFIATSYQYNITDEGKKELLKKPVIVTWSE